MKIRPEQYPVMIITALVLFTLLGLVLGFRPNHGGGHGFQVIFSI